jgi:hypothetical protein
VAVSFEYITEILDSIKDEEHALSSQIVIFISCIAQPNIKNV